MSLLTLRIPAALAVLAMSVASCEPDLSTIPSTTPANRAFTYLSPVLGNLQEATPGQPLAQLLVVQAVGPKGPAAGVRVTWTVVSGGVLDEPTVTFTDAEGMASARFTPSVDRASVSARVDDPTISPVLFRTVPRPTSVYARVLQSRICSSCEHYLFYADGSFELRYPSGFHVGGLFVSRDSIIALDFSPSGWFSASARLRADSLVVVYDVRMSLSDFDDGTFVLERGRALAPQQFIAQAWRQGWSAWSPAVSIELATPGADAGFNTGSLDGCPFIAPDGRQFFMASNRPGGMGGIDIWVSTREKASDPWGSPVNVAKVNSDVDDFCPTMSRDGHTLYFVSRRQAGLQGTDWCGGSDIYIARARDDQGFEAPENLGCTVNSTADEFSPFPLLEAGTGPVLYFSSTRPGLGSGGDLYESASHGGVFAAATPVPNVNSTVDDGQPNLRHDGLELFFYSNRAGGQGGNDIYVATRTSTADAWSTPSNLGGNVNSALSETRPSLSWDGLRLYFGSTRSGGEGGSDIYVTTRARLVPGG